MIDESGFSWLLLPRRYEGAVGPYWRPNLRWTKAHSAGIRPASSSTAEPCRNAKSACDAADARLSPYSRITCFRKKYIGCQTEFRRDGPYRELLNTLALDLPESSD